MPSGNQEREHDLGRVVEQLAACHAPVDPVRREIVPAQVRSPRGAHLVQQFGPQWTVAQPDEAYRAGVVRRRRGQRDGGGPAQDLRVDRVGAKARTERRISTASRRPAAIASFRAQPEQVLLDGPDQVVRCRAVVHRGQAAHHGRRHAAQLALDQIGRGRDLVRHGHFGDGQLVALRVDRAGVAVQHGQPRGADRRIGLADSPRAAHGVRDHDGDLDTEQPPDVGA